MMKLANSISNFKSTSSSLSSHIRRHYIDILIVFALVIVASVASYLGAQLINPIIVKLQNIWFNADTARVFNDMVSRGGDHSRLKVHPLFSLIAYPPIKVLEKALHLEPVVAVRIVIAAVAGLWLGALFITLRLLGCRRFDASII
ncbi:MAG: hypothetical protein HC936_05140 [Leptolyngbyaceae cyanobacterium SU_3_3]|nr:hypothetical protein [Leptolyngbyaceae cyanobacterium SU_3_3]